MSSKQCFFLLFVGLFVCFVVQILCKSCYDILLELLLFHSILTFECNHISVPGEPYPVKNDTIPSPALAPSIDNIVGM